MAEEEEEVITYDERFYYPDGTKKDLDGLKELWKRRINNQARSLLTDTDWYVSRKAEADTAIPDNVATFRAAIRTKSNELQTAIDDCDTFDKFVALFDPQVDKNGDWAGNPPIADWPTL